MASRNRAILKELLKHPGNKECADCTAKGPLWASTNLGVFLCIRCAGLHRKMGTHISKVKSVNLDTWKDEHVRKMRQVGNQKANEVYECNKPSHIRKPSERGDVERVERYIRSKYDQQVWLGRRKVTKKKPPRSPSPPSDEDGDDEEEERRRQQRKKELRKERRRQQLEKKREEEQAQRRRKRKKEKKVDHSPDILTFEKKPQDSFFANLMGNADPNSNFTPTSPKAEIEVEFTQHPTPSSPTAKGNNNNNPGDGLLQFETNPVSQGRKNKIMDMFERSKNEKPQTKQDKLLQWLNSGKYPSQQQRNQNPRMPQMNQRRTHHMQQRSPGGYPGHYGNQMMQRQNMVPKGRTVPLNFRGGFPNY